MAENHIGKKDITVRYFNNKKEIENELMNITKSIFTDQEKLSIFMKRVQEVINIRQLITADTIDMYQSCLDSFRQNKEFTVDQQKYLLHIAFDFIQITPIRNFFKILAKVCSISSPENIKFFDINPNKNFLNGDSRKKYIDHMCSKYNMQLNNIGNNIIGKNCMSDITFIVKMGFSFFARVGTRPRTNIGIPTKIKVQNAISTGHCSIIDGPYELQDTSKDVSGDGSDHNISEHAIEIPMCVPLHRTRNNVKHTICADSFEALLRNKLLKTKQQHMFDDNLASIISKHRKMCIVDLNDIIKDKNFGKDIHIACPCPDEQNQCNENIPLFKLRTFIGNLFPGNNNKKTREELHQYIDEWSIEYMKTISMHAFNRIVSCKNEKCKNNNKLFLLSKSHIVSLCPQCKTSHAGICHKYTCKECNKSQCLMCDDVEPHDICKNTCKHTCENCQGNHRNDENLVYPQVWCVTCQGGSKHFVNKHKIIYDCGTTGCYSCGATPFHDNAPCAYLAKNAPIDDQLEDTKTYLFMRICPGCKLSCIRTEGCTHMTCICKTEFCIKCGGYYIYDHICDDPHKLLQVGLF